jgi:hypothetical protein
MVNERNRLFSSTIYTTRYNERLMSWFRDRLPRAPQKLTPPTTRFVGEQDGVSERDLKACFVELFRKQPTVERAYLALAEHGDGRGVHVTLALRCPSGEDPSLIRRLANTFSSMFGSHEHLDMMFIREDQERQLQAVCKPFYRATD